MPTTTHNTYTHASSTGFHDQERADALLDEAAKMKDLDHPNILHLIGVCVDGGSTPHIVMPYMGNGSLLAHLRCDQNVFVIVNSRQPELVRDCLSYI